MTRTNGAICAYASSNKRLVVVDNIAKYLHIEA